MFHHHPLSRVFGLTTADGFAPPKVDQRPGGAAARRRSRRGDAAVLPGAEAAAGHLHLAGGVQPLSDPELPGREFLRAVGEVAGWEGGKFDGFWEGTRAGDLVLVR